MQARDGEPRWHVDVHGLRRLAWWGERVLVGCSDKITVLDARTGERVGALPTEIDRALVIPERLLVSGHRALTAWSPDLAVRREAAAGDVLEVVDAILARPAGDDVGPDLVGLGIDLLDVELRETIVRRALESPSPHGDRVAQEALGARTDTRLVRAAIESAPANAKWLQRDLEESARALDAVAIWPSLLARTPRYAWEARGRVVDAPEAVLRDPDGFAALAQAALDHRLSSLFLERAQRALDGGALDAGVVRAGREVFERALATYPASTELGAAWRRLAASARLEVAARDRTPRLRDRLIPVTHDAERARWESEHGWRAHAVLFEAIGAPAPEYHLPFPAAVQLKCLTVITPDRMPVAHGSWLVALELFAEGMLHVDEALAAASIPRPEPNVDPFGQRARGDFDTPAAKRFLEVAKTLGPTLDEACPALRERADEVVVELCSIGLRADHDELRGGVLTALAMGVAYHHAVYRVRAPGYEAFVDALVTRGAYQKPKRPSLAALTRSHPPVPYWPMHALDGPPRSAVESCVARAPGATCPALEASEVPTDDTGRPLDFLFQLALGSLRGLPDGFAHGAALIAVFGGARYAVVKLDAAALEGRETRPVPAGVVALSVGRKAKEPPHARWIQRVDPAAFPGRQSPDDVETLLGCYVVKTRDAHHRTSKIGGTYTPVQPFTTSLPESGALHLVAQLDFDDGAPLADAGLLYVIAMEGGGFHVCDEHL